MYTDKGLWKCNFKVNEIGIDSCKILQSYANLSESSFKIPLVGCKVLVPKYSKDKKNAAEIVHFLLSWFPIVILFNSQIEMKVLFYWSKLFWRDFQCSLPFMHIPSRILHNRRSSIQSQSSYMRLDRISGNIKQPDIRWYIAWLNRIPSRILHNHRISIQGQSSFVAGPDIR